MSEIRDLKCQCCKCYDGFDGCTAFDCQYDFEISMRKVREVSEESGMSVDAIIALLAMVEKKKKKESEENILPDNFNPFCDSRFLISFADSPGIGKKLLVEMDTDDLKRLRAEIDAALKVQEEK